MAFRSIPVESTKYDYSSSGGFIVPANRIATQDANRKIAEVPEWPYLCTRERELAKANRINSIKLAHQALIDKVGEIPAFDASLLEQSEILARVVAESRAYLGALSSDSEDDVQTKNAK